jgi:hypothetical protein
LFCEIKSNNLVDYYYSVLSKSEKNLLTDLIGQLRTVKTPESSFAIGMNQSLLFIKSDTANANYTNRNSSGNLEFYKIASWFKHFDLPNSFKRASGKANFWNFDGMVEPPSPPMPIDTTKLVMPLTSAL